MNISILNDYNLPQEYIDKLRAFLRLTTNEDDDLIKLLFSSAVDYAEKKLSIVIGKKDFSMKWPQIFFSRKSIFSEKKRSFPNFLTDVSKKINFDGLFKPKPKNKNLYCA